MLLNVVPTHKLEKVCIICALYNSVGFIVTSHLTLIYIYEFVFDRACFVQLFNNQITTKFVVING